MVFIKDTIVYSFDKKNKRVYIKRTKTHYGESENLIMKNSIINLGARVEGVLRDLELKRSNFWNVPRLSGEFLYELVRFLDARRVLEIGTSNGYSGIFLASALGVLDGAAGVGDDDAERDDGADLVGGLVREGCVERGRLFFTIESHTERYLEARGNFDRAGVSEFIVQIKGHAPEVFGGSEVLRETKFDLIFIDATKMEYESYLEAVLPMLKRGGLIVADNCISHAADLEGFFAAVDSLNLKSYMLPLDNGLFMIHL